MTNRGLRINLPLISVENKVWAAVLDCRGPDLCRYAIYLEEVHGGVYRRIRCHELLQISDSEDVPSPTTVYIHLSVSRILGRDRPQPQGTYYFYVFKDINRRDVTCRHYSPDDMAIWS